MFHGIHTIEGDVFYMPAKGNYHKFNYLFGVFCNFVWQTDNYKFYKL